LNKQQRHSASVRVLVDEAVPRRFARLLTAYDVQTVQEAGWSGLSNGELLRAAEDFGFDAFVTVDKKLPYQQNLTQYALGIVILHGQGIRFADLEPLLSATVTALESIQPGDVVGVGA
jgi:hypothetical protein